jgi:uncharacterized protein YciI
MEYLNPYYDKGIFLASGRKIPGTGGIILAKGSAKSEIEDLVREDPFAKLGLAQVSITEFNVSPIPVGTETFSLSGHIKA